MKSSKTWSKSLFILLIVSLSGTQAFAAKKKEKKLSKEFVEFRAQIIDRLVVLIDAGFKQKKIGKPVEFGVSNKSVRTKYGKAYHSKNMLRHTVTQTASTIAKIALSDWKNKSSQGQFDQRIVYWGDPIRRQHAAAISIEWWIGEETKYRESYIRLSIDQIWAQKEPKKDMISYPLTSISRELTLNHPVSVPPKTKIKSNVKGNKKAALNKPKTTKK